MQNPNGPPMGMPMPGPMPGQQMPTPQQIAAMQQQLAAEAAKHGMSVQDFVEHIRQQRMAQIQQMQQMQQRAQAEGGTPPGQGQPQGPPGQQQGPQGQGQPQGPQGQPRGPPPGAVPQPIRPGPPNPIAIALADFLRKQPLKPRVSIFNGERKEMFRVKRALRALQSPAYAKARAKNPALPEIRDRASLENTFKLLPMSMLALRVSQVDPHAGHNHGPVAPKKGKRVKGLWTVKIEQQQEAHDDMYYIWLYEGSQTMRKVYAVLALLVVFMLVLYPLWPLVLRQGVYYLSWGFLGLLGLFFLMAIFRVILFCITYFAVPPGLWLYPNLWEDVSFMDSFRPVWAWHETVKPKKKKSKKTTNAEASAHFAGTTGQAAPPSAMTTATETQMQTGGELQQRPGYVAPQVEELAE
ncbi:translocation protein Sec62-domain-containing protein [Microdochium trichocladiopsis]|uniref:Translocation protein SEC62 n=1 Tax=Microdochium trichocladiopsis TaxID=1682393 RepID=A0A9P8Y8S2_9PEZI|nr:translocation protein Sec62-domain-containing protein [Microdochium trichocladiopsis]KAH7030869.1 translocation protein Sec62-domain-containing protein [Microdochium trichocladiopsis]